MATWQADFFLIPRAALPDGGTHLTREDARDGEWWVGVELPTNYREQISAFAPPAPSWSKDLEMFGVEDGNRIDLWREHSEVSTILVRVDLRAPDPAFIAGILEFAKSTAAVLVRADGTVVEPEEAKFSEALEGSSAVGFVTDPASFFRRLRLGGLDDV